MPSTLRSQKMPMTRSAAKLAAGISTERRIAKHRKIMTTARKEQLTVCRAAPSPFTMVTRYAASKVPSPQPLALGEVASPQPLALSFAAPTSPAAGVKADASAELKAGCPLVVVEHCKIVYVEPAINSDKFIVMQSLTNAAGTDHYFCWRWGRTGTIGSVMVETCTSADAAKASLAKKFHEKTKNNYATVAAGTFTHIEGCYDLVRNPTQPATGTNTSGGCLWQYWVDDRVDGKIDGWYDYTAEAAQMVENVHCEWVNNSSLDVRCVQSGTFCYRVDFNTMQQTNVTHPGRKQRYIRRNV